ncbi:MAG: hypothetical protein HY308_15790 [Gammaproteobacteria bacterium]|nr:hypothetical protein [Gammaproteobacteria bacterium]
MSILYRTPVAFMLAPIIPSIVYVYLSWGQETSLFLFLLTIVVAYGLTIALMLPSFLILVRTRKFNIYSSTVIPFVILFLLSIAYSACSYGGFGAFEAGGDVLVMNGKITMEGWKNIVGDAGVVALLGSLGGIIFFIIQKIRLGEKSE